MCVWELMDDQLQLKAIKIKLPKAKASLVLVVSLLFHSKKLIISSSSQSLPPNRVSLNLCVKFLWTRSLTCRLPQFALANVAEAECLLLRWEYRNGKGVMSVSVVVCLSMIQMSCHLTWKMMYHKSSDKRRVSNKRRPPIVTGSLMDA